MILPCLGGYRTLRSNLFFIVKRQCGIQKDFQGQQEIAATLCFIFPKKAKRKKKIRTTTKNNPPQ